MSSQITQPLKLGFFSFFLGFLFNTCPVLAQDIPDQTIVNLAQSEQWLQLGFYQGDHGSYESEIVNSDYFLHPNGRNDPTSEFETFIRLALAYQEGGEALDLCRFPARLSFLAANTTLDIQPDCPEYQAFARFNELKSISLIFATGYFGNPSSYFGHLLLKSEYGDSEASNDFFDTGLNYGADVTDNPNSPIYVIKGLIGGYSGSYKPNNYFVHSHNYTNAQLRDVWRYELDLSDSEKRKIVELSWELQSATFTYYFFGDNCAHRIAKLIEMTTGKVLSENHGFWLMPIQVVRNLQRPTNLDRQLVKNKTYKASSLSQFIEKYERLDAKNQSSFEDFLYLDPKAKVSSEMALNPYYLNLALDYYDVRMARLNQKKADPEESSSIQGQRQVLLLSVLRASPDDQVERESSDFSGATHGSPDQANFPSRFALTAKTYDGEAFLRTTYRAANNDLLDDSSVGQMRSKLIMGEVTIDWHADQIDVSRVVAFDVLSLNANPLPSNLWSHYSWELALEYRNLDTSCTSCDTIAFDALAGYSYQFGNTNTGYLLIGGSLHTVSGESGFSSQVSRAGITGKWTSHFNYSLEFENRIYTGGRSNDYAVDFVIAYKADQPEDMRARLRLDDQGFSMELTKSWYFD